MKILLLGAGGFIGANLAERLVDDGHHQITALDIEREKLDETVKSGEINYIHFDIRRNEKELERLTMSTIWLSISWRWRTRASMSAIRSTSSS